MALTLMAVEGFLQSRNILTSTVVADSILSALFIVAIWFTRTFPDWYRGFLFRRLSKEKEDMAANPYLQGNYAPIQDEISATNLPVEGILPSALQGIYMRNGPNPAFPPISYTYPIDGDGMLHAVYIQDGNASYPFNFTK